MPAPLATRALERRRDSLLRQLNGVSRFLGGPVYLPSTVVLGATVTRRRPKKVPSVAQDGPTTTRATVAPEACDRAYAAWMAAERATGGMFSVDPIVREARARYLEARWGTRVEAKALRALRAESSRLIHMETHAYPA